MAQLPADRTKLNAAVANQQPSIVASAKANREALIEAYDTIDLLNQKVDTAINNGKMGNEISSDVDMRGYRIRNLAAPTSNTDAARKADVDAHATRTDNPHGTTAEQVGAPRLTTVIPNGVSLNTVVTSGFYRLSGSHPDAPPGTEHGQMIVSRGGDTVLQIVTGFNYSHFYMRHGNPPEAGGLGVWQPWRELWHDGNNPASLATNGYQIFASGAIVQHGRVAVSGNNAANAVTFPIVFPNDCDVVVGVLEGPAGAPVSIESITPSGFTARSTAPSLTTLHYIAWGR